MLRFCKPGTSSRLLTKHNAILAAKARSVRRSASGCTAVLSNTSVLLRNLQNGAEIFLIGTAHVSKASAEEVSATIHAVKPDTVFVELDAQRARKLMYGHAEEADFLKGFFAGLGAPLKLPGHLMEHGIKGLYKMLKSMGLDPGLEFKVAIEEAQKLRAKVVFGDQDQNTTMSNLKAAISFKDIFKLMGNSTIVNDPELQQSFQAASGMAASVEAMKTRKAARAMTKALRDVNPKLAKALIDDRDKYMIQGLRQLQGRVVGVVGLGHLDGMERLWEQGNIHATRIES